MAHEGDFTEQVLYRRATDHTELAGSHHRRFLSINTVRMCERLFPAVACRLSKPAA